MTERDFENFWAKLEPKLLKLTESEKREVLARAEQILTSESRESKADAERRSQK